MTPPTRTPVWIDFLRQALTVTLVLGAGIVVCCTAGCNPQSPTEKKTVEQVREEVVGKMTREKVKSRFGKPDRTVEGAGKVDWIWDGNVGVWNPDSETYYRTIEIRFPLEGDQTATKVSAR